MVRQQDERSGGGLVTPGDTEGVPDPLCSPTSPLSTFSQWDGDLLWGQRPGDEPVSSALRSPSLCGESEWGEGEGILSPLPTLLANLGRWLRLGERKQEKSESPGL